MKTVFRILAAFSLIFSVESIHAKNTANMTIDVIFQDAFGGGATYEFKLKGVDDPSLSFVPEKGKVSISEKKPNESEITESVYTLTDKESDQLLQYIISSEIMNLTEEMDFGSHSMMFILDGYSASIELEYKDYKKKVSRFQAAASTPMNNLFAFLSEFKSKLKK